MDHSHHSQPNLPIAHPTLKDYVPLMLVFATIFIGTIGICAQVGFSIESVLAASMGLFFLIFGMFKVLDLGMFAMGYREYDLIAKYVPAWGYLYPFIELALGGLYLAGINQPWLNWLTLVLSAVVVVGVGIKLAKRETIMCVCLGNILKVPLTYVSLAEYAVMGGMAVWMLAL